MEFVSISFSERFALFLKIMCIAYGIVHVNSGAGGDQNKGVESLDPWELELLAAVSSPTRVLRSERHSSGGAASTLSC